VIAQYRNCAIGRLLRGGSHNYYCAALFDVIGVKFLVADIVWLFAGLVACFVFFKRATGADKRSIQLRCGSWGLVDGSPGVFAVRASFVDIGDHFHLVAVDTGYLQILNSSLRHLRNYLKFRRSRIA